MISGGNHDGVIEEASLLQDIHHFHQVLIDMMLEAGIKIPEK